jgi:short-subunit dehydrogenase
LITGASAGVGAALARELVRRDQAGSLVLTARRAERLKELAAELSRRRSHLETHIVAADLADPATPRQLFDESVARFGGVDVLINNAGLGLPTLFAGASPEQLTGQISVNLVAPLVLTRLFLPTLIERKGMIVNIGSAITCVANSALGAYGATKAGLAYWNDALRRELLGTGVRVCLVEPGPITTEFMDAVNARVSRGERAHPILDSAAPWMTAPVDEVARRVVCLLEHPRRRLSVLRRLVWPLRLLGAVARVCPPAGDVVVRLFQREGRS